VTLSDWYEVIFLQQMNHAISETIVTCLWLTCSPAPSGVTV